MAGYIFNLDSEDSLKYCIENGVYSTRLSLPVNKIWKSHHEGTFADYFTMKEGDNVYFFIKRNIYGIGEIINLGDICYALNYPNADLPINYNFLDIKDDALLNENDDNLKNRCICFFKPSPSFFINGIDMDDVLSSNPSKFNILRAFWKLSFIKLPDEENQALKNIILVRNEEFINQNCQQFQYSDRLHKKILKKIMIKPYYEFNHKNLLKYSFKEYSIKHEMAIEASILSIISKDFNTIFGKWDYLSHQVIASPFKAIDYMDKMDIFGYRYIEGFTTISRYLCIEIKKDKARVEDIDQLMKYIDWINNEYTYGNYGMIEAFIVAYHIPFEVLEYKNKIAKRNYIQGLRPTTSKIWENVRLIEYKYNAKVSDLEFREINK